jgi:hypothetical protein
VISACSPLLERDCETRVQRARRRLLPQDAEGQLGLAGPLSRILRPHERLQVVQVERVIVRQLARSLLGVTKRLRVIVPPAPNLGLGLAQLLGLCDDVVDPVVGNRSRGVRNTPVCRTLRRGSPFSWSPAREIVQGFAPDPRVDRRVWLTVPRWYGCCDQASSSEYRFRLCGFRCTFVRQVGEVEIRQPAP